MWVLVAPAWTCTEQGLIGISRRTSLWAYHPQSSHVSPLLPPSFPQFCLSQALWPEQGARSRKYWTVVSQRKSEDTSTVGGPWVVLRAECTGGVLCRAQQVGPPPASHCSDAPGQVLAPLPCLVAWPVPFTLSCYCLFACGVTVLDDNDLLSSRVPPSLSS